MAETLLTLVVVALLVKPLGDYIARVMMGQATFMFRLLGWLEGGIYRFMDILPAEEMEWKHYTRSMLLFSFCGFALLYLILVGQAYLPLNPQGLPGVPADLAFNIAMSFITDTNWQSYSPEKTLSHFSQMVGITVQGFACVGVGIAVAAALTRGIRRKQTDRIGNFWADVVRAVLYILLPLSLLWAILLSSQGVVQYLGAYPPIVTLEGQEQTVAIGPAASQVAIKQVGANGGGFFAANSAHPFENPTPFSNLLQMIAILLLPAAMLYAFGVMVGDWRQGIVLLATATMVLLLGLGVLINEERKPNPMLPEILRNNGSGNMQGKETRIGTDASAAWGALVTATSNGSINSSHDSYRPLGSLVPLLLTAMTGGKFGGVGTGLCCMIIFVIIAVFLGGMMAGRTPEYMGNKLQPYDIKMAALFILIPPLFTLVGTAIAVSTDAGRAGISGEGAHGFSEVLYAFSTAASNNGSAFGGISANTPFYNTALGICIFAGRFLLLVPVLALAGSLAEKNPMPVTAATLPTHTPLFAFLLFITVLLVDIMTYIPVLALGPIVEHLHLVALRLSEVPVP